MELIWVNSVHRAPATLHGAQHREELPSGKLSHLIELVRGRNRVVTAILFLTVWQPTVHFNTYKSLAPIIIID